MTGTLLQPRCRREAALVLPPARLFVWVWIALSGLCNLVYILYAAPGLAPDEAHYWDWSRRLDWCYYSKGPLVAWLIRLSSEVVGPLFSLLGGAESAAVRFPAVVCNLGILLGLARAAARWKSERFALGLVVAVTSIPTLGAGSFLMTIDAPFLLAWTWALLLAAEAMEQKSLRPWLTVGIWMAVGLLAKQTMILLPSFLVAYTFFRKLPCRRGVVLSAGVAALGLLPLVVWNARNQWAGFRHLIVLAAGPDENGAPETQFAGVMGLAEFFVVQFALLFGFWFVAWIRGTLCYQQEIATDPRTRFLRAVSLFVAGFFAVMSLKTKSQANWTLPAYFAGILPTAVWIERELGSSRGPRLSRWLVVFVVVGLMTSTLFRFPEVWRPLLTRIAPGPTIEQPTPVRKLDPTCRLSGWKTLASEVDRLRDQVRHEEGHSPYLATMNWFTPGELGFYCQGHPEVYSFGAALDDRHSQYDFWHPNPLADAQAFRGATFVYVGEINPRLVEAFERIDPPVEVTASDGGVPTAHWRIRVLRGFRGFPEDPRVQREAGY